MYEKNNTVATPPLQGKVAVTSLVKRWDVLEFHATEDAVHDVRSMHRVVIWVVRMVLGLQLC